MTRWLEHAVIGLFTLLCTVVFGEVVARYVFNHPYFWSEEITVYTFTWVAFLGAALALRSGRHVSISYFVSRMPATGQAMAGLLADGLVLAFLVLLAVQGVRFCLMNHTLASIALNIPLSFVSASLIVMTTAMMLYTAASIWAKVRALGSGRIGGAVSDTSVDERMT
jgi:TRAP-type C4-dicarboxylate transport system permease small subunit